MMNIDEELDYWALKLYGTSFIRSDRYTESLLRAHVSNINKLQANKVDMYIDWVKNPRVATNVKGKYGDEFTVTTKPEVRDSYTGKLYKLVFRDGGYVIMPYVSSRTGKGHIEIFHQLIAKGFHENDDPEHKIWIDHIDGNKWNYMPWNIEWVTPGENQLRAYKMGLKVNKKGEDSALSIYSEAQVRQVCQLLQDRPDLPFNKIAEITGVSLAAISGIRSGHTWSSVARDYNFPKRDTDRLKGLWGVNNKNSKFSDATIREICDILQNFPEVPFVEIAETFGMSDVTVSDIYRGRVRTNITKDYNFPDRSITIHNKPKMRGENNYNSAYTNQQIIQVCELLRDRPDMPYPKISQITGVSVGVIGDVYTGIGWKHISKDYVPFPPRESHNHLTGELNPWTKFSTDNLVKVCNELNSTYKANGRVRKADMRDIADKIGVSRSVVEMIYFNCGHKDISKDYDFIKERYKKEG